MLNFIKLILLISCSVFSLHSYSNSSTHKNALYQHASDYLAMHGQDPINWLDWQQATLKKSTAENKLIMISSGYFSCHWCHVMQTENYHDIETANYLNKHFISVKIDRELTPDLDRYLIDFAQRSAGHAGWPQHVFLTPDGYPFFAFTYQPKPDFLLNLKKIQNFWQKNKNKVIKAAKSAVLVNNKQTTYKLDTIEFYRAFTEQLAPQMDMLSGGLKGSNKFPNASILKTALLLPKADEEITEWLITSLDQMQSQHLFDHIYGGFYRYTVDPEWQTPHFEKMLYTQAQLAEIYLIAGEKYQRQDYLTTAQKTLDYVQQQLFHPLSGLYQSSQSAVNKQQVEAADYVWTKQQLKNLLSQQAFQQISKEWLTEQTSYEIPINDKMKLAWHPKPTLKHWQAIKSILKDNKIKPIKDIPTDSKSILGWNGLLLTAFSKAVQMKKLESKTAQNLADALIKQLDKPQPPRALSATNKNMGQANIQDYAYVIQGLENWAKVSKNQTLKDKIKHYRKIAKEKFFNHQGWLYSDTPILPGQTASKAITDNAMPSPTAILGCQLTNSLLKNPLSFASYAQENCQ